MYNEIITHYFKNPFNKFEMDDCSIEHSEDNDTCWDALTVYLKIKDDKIENWSFSWDTAIITTSCASVMWESVIWMSLEEVLNLDYDYIEELVEQEISTRRKKASVLALLTTRNAIHKYLEDWIEDDFDDLIN